MDALPDQRLIRVPVQLRLPLPDHPQFRLVQAPAPAPGPGGGANPTSITVRVQHAQDVDCLETIGNNSVSYDTVSLVLRRLRRQHLKLLRCWAKD